MDLHPKRGELVKRVRAWGQKWDARCELGLFRFVDPRFCKAADIVSGDGALRASGRWHLQGEFRIGYTATEPETALAEALASARYYNLPLETALPRVLVSLRLKAACVLDLHDAGCRRELDLPVETLATTDWRRENQNGHEAVTQAWGAAFAAAGFEAAIVPSAASPDGSNVLIFPQNLQASSQFVVEREVVVP